jgi:hypothetical protein
LTGGSTLLDVDGVLLVLDPEDAFDGGLLDAA